MSTWAKKKPNDSLLSGAVALQCLTEGVGSAGLGGLPEAGLKPRPSLQTSMPPRHRLCPPLLCYTREHLTTTGEAGGISFLPRPQRNSVKPMMTGL